ncbi:hypothetical protein ACVWVY_004962 [Bradyrhizobium sp. URHC0002]
MGTTTPTPPQQSVLHGFATRTPLKGHEANLNFATLTVFETFDYAKSACALVCRWPFGPAAP